MKKRTRIKVAAGNRPEDKIIVSPELRDVLRTNPFRAAWLMQHEAMHTLYGYPSSAQDVPGSQADCDIIGWIGVALEEQAAHEQYKRNIWTALREFVKLMPADTLRELVTSREFSDWACKHRVLME